MRFWRFLAYERPALLLQAISFVLIILVFATAPESSPLWSNVLYALMLVLLVTVGFYIYRYYRTLHAIRHSAMEDAAPLSMEAASYLQAMDEQEKAHIRALNHVQEQQREHYDFIVSWFHEIKTPISVLRLMQQTEMDAASLEEELTRIEHYVDQALYYAKLDTFNQDYELMNCDLSVLMKSLVKQHAKTFISRRIRVQLELEPLIVQTDTKWLQFIVNQVLTNSLKYTAPGGEITIRTQVTTKEKLLLIRDSGIGIKPEDLPRIFNRGFSGINGRAVMKSTGMGLFLAQELSRKLGHYLTATSEPSRYTELIVHFPKHHDPHRGLLLETARD
ncbi:signal transduction histidine kinase [Paenibacillus phyllosphaerae]|uniref:histidine kinase n=1 Tax=Paenibacillus phyllosphaerae TaxID=274593 RepID=A0A7W5B5E2_9BACL|nr:sensor histidine kinase [Paenibacillus phyllosphaerae]MBB3114587.1 signal transduction histidine kinase [Paenibacillus phyllosphaerae]